MDSHIIAICHSSIKNADSKPRKYLLMGTQTDDDGQTILDFSKYVINTNHIVYVCGSFSLRGPCGTKQCSVHLHFTHVVRFPWPLRDDLDK